MDMSAFKDNAFGENKGEKLAMTTKEAYDLGMRIAVKLAAEAIIKSPPIETSSKMPPAKETPLPKPNAASEKHMDEMGGRLAGGKPISKEDAAKRTKKTFYRAGM